MKKQIAIVAVIGASYDRKGTSGTHGRFSDLKRRVNARHGLTLIGSSLRRVGRPVSAAFFRRKANPMNHVFNQTGRNLLAAILALSSAACSVLSYQPPSTGDMARLRVVTLEASHTEIFVLPEARDGCTTGRTKNWQWFAILGQHSLREGLQGVTIGIPGAEAFKPTAIAESTIPAGKPLSLDLTRAGYNYTCGINLMFVPRAGVDYEATFTQGGRECHARVAELKRSSDGSVTRSPVETFPVEFCKSS
jgi:hypothetical protein